MSSMQGRCTQGEIEYLDIVSYIVEYVANTYCWNQFSQQILSVPVYFIVQSPK